MTIRKRETGFNPVGILGMRLRWIEWGGCSCYQMPSALFLEADGGESEQVRLRSVLKDFRIRQVRMQRRSAPALRESGLECSVSATYMSLTTVNQDCKVRPQMTLCINARVVACVSKQPSWMACLS